MYYGARLPVRDPSNGLRLFSRRVIEQIAVESTAGFCYSIELLVKCHRLGWPIGEVPFTWYERKVGQSRFRVMKWVPKYLRWYFYAFATTWLGARSGDDENAANGLGLRADVMAKSYLVTGGSGFIGAALVRRLVARGERVRVLDNLSRGNQRRLGDVVGDVEFVEADIRDAAAVSRAAKGIDCVVHAAFVNGTQFFYSMPQLVLDVGDPRHAQRARRVPGA